MHRVDGAGFAPGNLFTEGDPATNTPATTVTAAIMNALQEEVAGLVEASGIALVKANDAQLLQAIKRLAGKYSTTITSAQSPMTLTADHAGLLLIDASAGNVVINMPAANHAARPFFNCIRVDTNSANSATLQRAGADTIEGSVSVALPVGFRGTFVADGAAQHRHLGLMTGMQIGYKKNETNATERTAPADGALIPYDNTPPQKTEGKEFVDIATSYTPLYASSDLEGEVYLPYTCIENATGVGSPNDVGLAIALFRDDAPDAIAVAVRALTAPATVGTFRDWEPMTLKVVVPANAAALTTFRLRFGPVRHDVPTGIGHQSSGDEFLFGASRKAYMIIREIRK